MLKRLNRLLLEDAYPDEIAKSPQEAIASFYTLSSGEKEILSILLDISFCQADTLFVLDEVELHLHPSIQSSLVTELISLISDRPNFFLLLATHSPSVILTENLESLWWMKSSAEVKEGGNQLTPMGSDFTKTEAMFELYSGCSINPKARELLILAQEKEFAVYLEQCYQPAGVAGNQKGKDSDPQISSIRCAIQSCLSEKNTITFLDFGCGRARCLNAFNSIEPQERKKVNLILIDRDLARLERAVQAVPFIKDFQSNSCRNNLNGVQDVDYAVLANVLHEVVGVDFIDCFTEVWKSIKIGGKLHILEIAELITGEKDFLSLSSEGYRALFASLEPKASVVSSPSRNGLRLLNIVVTKGKDVDRDAVTKAYLKALETTKKECLGQLENSKIDKHRAFYLENLASIVKTYDSLQAPAGVR